MYTVCVFCFIEMLIATIMHFHMHILGDKRHNQIPKIQIEYCIAVSIMYHTVTASHIVEELQKNSTPLASRIAGWG